MKLLRLYIIFITLLLNLIGYSQPSQTIQGLDLLGNKSYIDVPFQLEHGFIIVKAKFQNTLTLNFIFDTGAGNTILFDKEYADLFDIEFDRTIQIMGSDFSEGMLAHIARNLHFELEGSRSVTRDIVFLDSNILLLKEKLGIKIDGIIGCSYFQNLVAHINYKKKYIRFYHPLKAKEKIYKDYEKMDIEVLDFKPYLTCKTIFNNNNTAHLKYLLDTGASLPYLLHMNTHEMINLPYNIIRGNLGYGLSGIIMGYIGQIRELQLGSFSFPNVIVNFQEVEEGFILDHSIERNGIIGNDVLRRFHIIIDFLRSRLYLKPINKKKYAKTFDFDRSGLIIFAVGADLNEFLIKQVLKDSPSEKSDIRPGDTLLRVAGRSTKSLSLESIYRTLKRKTGKTIKIVIKRNNVKIKKEVHLEDLLGTIPKK